MKLELEVLASSSIKRTKSWPKIVWVGEEHESLFLLDNDYHRISVLYVPSGKTKKKISKLSPLVQDTVVISSTRSGSFVLGLMKNGDLFIWHKDRDVLKTIHGLGGVVSPVELQKEKCLLFASNDCHHILLVIGTQNIFVWKLEQSDSIFDSQVPDINGSWNKVALPRDSSVPESTNDSPDLSLDAVFFSHQGLGQCCQLSYVFNRQDCVCIITALLKFGETSALYNPKMPAFLVEWTSIQYPFKHIHPSYELLQSRGASVCCYSNSGQVIAVAANQNVPGHSSMMFVSPLTDTVLVSDLKGCGVSDPYSRMGRLYWVKSMAWTCDDLFVCCIMKSGAVCMLTRLGEPMLIHTHGNGMDIGPAYYLPLHPKQYISRISSRTDGRPSTPDSIISESDSSKQRLSVSTHPSLPIILFSDGFMVSIIQFPVDMTCSSLMRDLVLLSSRHLKGISQQQNMDLTLVNAYGMPSSREEKSARQGHHMKNKKKKQFSFEPPESTLNTTQESEGSFLDDNKQDMYMGLTEGKISFAETEIPLIDPSDLSGLDTLSMSSKRLDIATNCLLSAWKLAVSYHEPWSVDIDHIAKQICQNLTKLFSITLDCPGMQENSSPSAQNPRLFSVISIYRKTLELLRFDIISQHLLPVSLRLCYHSISLILNSTELQASDRRLKTLSGCFTIMKFTETMLNRVYVWVPREIAYSKEPTSSRSEQHAYEPAILVTSQLSPRSAARELSRQNAKGVALDQQNQLPSKRLCGAWKLLYKNLLVHQNELQQTRVDNKVMEQLNSLIIAVQQTVQELDGELPRKASPSISQGDKLSLDGMHTMAVDAWKNQLHNLVDESVDVQKSSKVLHSILYTHIMKGELDKAVDLVDSLIVQANINSPVNKDQVEESSAKLSLMTIVTNTLKLQKTNEGDQLVPCIRNRAIRQLVQSLARFMAAYFGNETLYVFPPHNAQPIHAVHLGAIQINERIIPRYHEEVTNAIRQMGLSSVWTTERTLEYLLLSGLVCEAVWFANKMGDWKAAFLLSVACTCHHNIAPRLYKKNRKPLVLPEELSPSNILQGKLDAVINFDKSKTGATVQRDKRDFIPIDNETNIVQLSRTIEDILTAGILSDVDIVPWLLSGLVGRLKHAVSNFPPLVPKDFYLPAPPLYCPQPSVTAQESGGSSETEREKRLRFQISSLVQLVLVVFNASHTSLAAAGWYAQELTKAQDKAKQFKATTEGPCLEFPEVLQKYQILKSQLTALRKDKSVQRVLTSFRDFCSIMWLLHARDKLSRSLREREEYMNKVKYEDYMRASWDSKEGDKWVKECFTNLQWAVHMLSFSRFLSDEACLYKIILSLLQELPPKEDTADILAEYFHDSESLDPEVQEKLDKLLAVWQGVFNVPEDDGKSARPTDDNDEENEGRKSVTFLQVSPRGRILSVYYFKQCEIVTKVLKKKRKVFGGFEEYVFDLSGKLDVRDSLNGRKYSNRHVGCRPFETKTSYLEFLDNFFAISFTKLMETDGAKHSNFNSLPLLLPFSEEISVHQFTMHQSSLGNRKPHSLVVMTTPNQKVISRSQSESNVQVGSGVPLSGKSRGMYRSTSEGEPNRYTSPRSGVGSRSPKGKMTGMASKFSQSEEALYKAPALEDEPIWSVNTNFGQKYHHLENLLDWLSVWGKKNHSLGLNRPGEKDIDFRPTMKIDVPPTLVVLALWLVENKYSPSKKSQRSSRSNSGDPGVQNLSVINEDVSRVSNTSVLQETPVVEDIIVPQTNSKKVRGQASMRSTAGDRLTMSSSFRSLTSQRSGGSEFDQETEDVHTAYERVLDNPEPKDDSSSLEVSSLGTDEYEPELKHTLSLIRGSGTVKKGKRENSPFGGNRSSNSPVRSRNPSPKSSTPKSLHSQSRTGNPGGHQQFGNDLAYQLQDIVRSELRRLMEAQHMNMMAMMGALDGEDNSQSRLPFPPRQKSPQRKAQQQSRGTSPLRATMEDTNRSTMVMDELEESRFRQSRKNKQSVRGALSELKNLQDSYVEDPGRSRQSRKRSPGKENRGGSLHMSQLKPEYAQMHHGGQENIDVYHIQQQGNDPMHFIPKFLRIPAERDTDDVKFPHIPGRAWEDRHDNEYEPQQENFQIPLLNVQGANAPSRIFPGVNQYPGEQMPNIPPPHQTAYGGPPQYDHNIPIMGFSQHQQQSDNTNKHGIPLLQIPKETTPFLGPKVETSFGRLLAPHLIIGNEQERHQKELTKQKYAREFHRQQVEDLEELEKSRFGENLLKVNLQFQEMKERHEGVQEKKIKKTKKKVVKIDSLTESSEPEKVSTPKRSKTPSPRTPRRKVITPSTEEDQDEEEEGEEEEEEESTDRAETEEEEGKLYDGYAIKQGTFDNYLRMDGKLGPEADTNARIQYRTAMILKKQREKRKKVDFATNTTDYADAQIETDIAMEMESVRTAEAATSITKDTGVDPIQEAIVEYNLARQGNVLPPDIYMGLRFGDAEGQPTSDVAPGTAQEKPKGRSYLNVVDLDASMVLKDLRKIREEEKVQEDIGFKPSSETLTSARNRAEIGGIRQYEEFVRESMEPKKTKETNFWQDAVTLKMFEQKMPGDKDDRISVALMPREGMRDTRSQIINRLRDMNSQMLAIDQMSSNIDNEFQRTRMMMNTLEVLGGVDQPLHPDEERDHDLSRSRTPSPMRTRSPSPKARKSPKPSSVRDSGKSDEFAPKMSVKSPSISARTTARSTVKTSSLKSSADLVKMSGLSGISDIIGDMVQRGEIDLEDAGFTPKEAEIFAKQAKFSARTEDDQERVKKSLELLEKMGTKVIIDEEDNMVVEQNKEELRAWMSEKRARQMEDYIRQRSELREREHKPFKSGADTSFKGQAKDLQNQRKDLGSKNMQRRLQDAQHLLSDIITDKPKLPVAAPTRDVSPKRRTIMKDPSPKRKTVTLSPPRKDRDFSPKRQTVTISEAAPQMRGYTPDVTPKKDLKKAVSLQAVSRLIQVKSKRDPGMFDDEEPYHSPIVPKLKLIDSGELLKTAETTGEISAYAKAVEAMEVSGSQDMWSVDRRQPPQQESQQRYKPKPYTEIVKVQRPEITRKRPMVKSSHPYPRPQDDYMSYDQEDTDRSVRKHSSRELTLEEKQKIYGSKHLPGSKIPVPSHRNVKTYTERLQEMKSGQRMQSKPIVPRSQGGSSMRSSQYTHVIPRRKTGPPHKPLTYVEQLQKLSAGANKPRGTTARVKQATFMRSHKPVHRPMTYAEQLKSLQPKPKVRRMAPSRMDTRQRPYADPYRDGDADSVVSDWSVDDNVRKLLYDDETATETYIHASAEYPMSEGISDYYDVIMGSSEYVGSVDITEIEQIADAASVSEGSIMSVIDWDAVDNLIYDNN